MTNGNRTIIVWWIDDDHTDDTGPREAERTELTRQAGAALDLVAIHPAEFERYATRETNESAPDLLLIDFRLGMRAHPDPDHPTPYFARDGVRLRGTTLGDETLKEVPAYLVSRVIGDSQTGSSDDQFDWVLSHRQLIERGGAFLLADAADYRLLRDRHEAASRPDDPGQTRRDLVDAICELLRVPDSSRESVEEPARYAISHLLRNEFHLDSDEVKLAPSRYRAIARWVRTHLQATRGPLVDERSVANMLGSTYEYFKETLEPQLDLDALRYTGIFHRTATMIFWRQAFLQWLLSQDENIQISPPSKMAKSAAALFDVPEAERAKCRVCGKPWPEAIAFDADESTVEDAVHWRCSMEATDRETPLGFDVPRSFS